MRSNRHLEESGTHRIGDGVYDSRGGSEYGWFADASHPIGRIICLVFYHYGFQFGNIQTGGQKVFMECPP